MVSSEDINSRPKTPFRFYIYGAIALFVMVSTLLWMANYFGGSSSQDSSMQKAKPLKDARMLRSM